MITPLYIGAKPGIGLLFGATISGAGFSIYY